MIFKKPIFICRVISLNRRQFQRASGMFIAGFLSLILAVQQGFASNPAEYFSEIDDTKIVEMFGRMNLDYPGLEKVRAAVEAGDYQAAEAAYLEHYRSRKQPVLSWRNSYGLKEDFKANSASWDFLTSHPDVISWRDREKVKGLISREMGYISKGIEGLKISEYTLLDHADMMLDNKIFIPYHPEDGVQYLGQDWDWEHMPPPGGSGKRWTLSLPYQYCLRALAQAWWLTNDEKYIAKLVKIATDYINYLPGKSDWIWLPDMQLARNYQQLMPFILSGEKLAPRDFCTIQYFLSGPCAESMEAVKGAPGNQMLFNGIGILWIGVGMPEFKAAQRWRERGMLQVNQYFGEWANYPDGSSKENSYGYVAGASPSGFEAIKLARDNGWGLPEGLDEAMLKRAEFLAYTSKPDGNYVWTGDSRRGTGFPYVLQIADLYNRTDLQFISSFGQSGLSPERSSFWYSWAGVGIMRSGWNRDANYLFYDVGPVGVVHKHEGKLAIEVVAYGRSMVEDLGLHTYGRDPVDIPWHKFFHRTIGHNTVIVDGKTQVRRTTGPEVSLQTLSNPWLSTTTCDFLSGSYTQGYDDNRTIGHDDSGFVEIAENIDDSVVHYRSVVFIKARKAGDPEYWIVTDRLTGSGEHTYEQLFHLIPVEVRTDQLTGSVRTVTPDQPNLAFIPTSTEDLELEIAEGRTEPCLQGWYCGEGGGGRPVPAPCVIYRKTGEPAITFQTVLWPMRTGEDILPEVEALGKSDSGWVKVTLPDGSFDIYCSPPVPGRYELEHIVFDDMAALVRLDKEGQAVAGEVVRGKNLSYKGRQLVK